jgi:hypothetical protein
MRIKFRPFSQAWGEFDATGSWRTRKTLMLTHGPLFKPHQYALQDIGRPGEELRYHGGYTMRQILRDST